MPCAYMWMQWRPFPYIVYFEYDAALDTYPSNTQLHEDSGKSYQVQALGRDRMRIYLQIWSECTVGPESVSSFDTHLGLWWASSSETMEWWAKECCGWAGSIAAPLCAWMLLTDESPSWVSSWGLGTRKGHRVGHAILGSSLSSCLLKCCILAFYSTHLNLRHACIFKGGFLFHYVFLKQAFVMLSVSPAGIQVFCDLGTCFSVLAPSTHYVITLAEWRDDFAVVSWLCSLSWTQLRKVIFNRFKELLICLFHV